MTKTNRTVVGIDGSPTSIDALQWALADTALRGDDLDIVHAWMPEVISIVGGIPITQDPLESEIAAKAHLESVADTALAEAPDQPTIVRTHLVRGEAATMLTVESRRANQIVLGADGHGALRRMVVGSTTDKCVADALCTVTVVPRCETPGDGRIVVGVDESDGSLAALAWAFDEATLRDAPLVVVHAVPSTLDLVSVTARAFATGNGRVLVGDMIERIDDGEGTPRSVAVLSGFGTAAQLLVDTAEGASLLVVGSDRAGRVGRFLGRTARKCVHHAPCPTTVVKVRS